MITDVVIVQSARVKTQIIKFNVQRIKVLASLAKFVVDEGYMIKSKFIFVLTS